jgi:predicted PurR-regulated permease PerM
LLGEISIPALAGHVLAGLQGLVSSLFLVLVYFGFMLAERSRLPKKIRQIAGSSEHSTSILKGTSRIAADIQTYVWVQTLTGFMLAAVSAIVMFAVGLENALFWTFVLFLLSFIPVIGVTVGSVAPALFALLQFPTIWQSVVVFVSIQVAAAIVGNIIYPKMQAQTQNIGSVATLLALAFWSALWGLPGAFLAVPMTLMLMMVFANFQNTRWIAVILSNDGEPNFPTMLTPQRDSSGTT